MRSRYSDAGKAELFAAMQPYLLGSNGLPSYDEPAGRLNMRRGAFAMAVMRLREDYAAALTEAVAQTVPDPGDVEEELRYLMSLFAA